jgi:hypothetical protein
MTNKLIIFLDSKYKIDDAKLLNELNKNGITNPSREYFNTNNINHSVVYCTINDREQYESALAHGIVIENQKLHCIGFE